jgi:Calcium-activated chloride channel.
MYAHRYLAYIYAEEIRLYFGEAVALYFTFLGFYTVALLLPMVLGFLQLFLFTESIAFFSVFNVLWVTIFLEVSSFSKSFGTLFGPHNIRTYVNKISSSLLTWQYHYKA